MNAQTCFVPTLNGTTEIDASFIRNFELISSISGQLPIGFMDFFDFDGSFLSSYENISIGTPITFNTLTDSDDEALKRFSFKEFVILQVESIADDSSAGQFDRIKGNIRVWFGHKWYIFKDTKNHAYSPMKNSKLVKKILEDKTRGVQFKIKKIEDSDDDGRVSRYKTCESDLDFLNNKVIPFSSHKKLPMYLFCNISNEFTFASFQTLYNQKPKALYTPSNIKEDEGYDTVAAEIEKESLKCENSANFIHATVSMGDKDFLDNSRIHFFLEGSGEGTFIAGTKNPLNVVGKSSGSHFANLLPINKYFSLASKGSSVFTVRNRLLQDSMSLLYSKTKSLDSCFRLIISGYFDAKHFNIGETVNVYFNLGNWLNGKWLIESYMVSAQQEDNTKNYLIQSLVLVRPTFCGDENTTTLNASSMMSMYSVQEA